MATKLVRKLSTKTILGERPTVDKATKRKHLYNVMGVARKTQTGESDNGPWVAFIGDFAAFVPNAPGEIIRAPKVFLPPGYSETMENALMEAIERNEQAREKKDGGPVPPASIEFGVKVFIDYDEDSATGYIYNCEPMFEERAADPINGLLERAGARLPKALQSPEQKQLAKK